MQKTVEGYSRELEDCLSASLRITSDQVDRIVVYGLIKKYKGLEKTVAMNGGRKEQCLKDMTHFKEVLRYYLSDKEIDKSLKD